MKILKGIGVGAHIYITHLIFFIDILSFRDGALRDASNFHA